MRPLLYVCNAHKRRYPGAELMDEKGRKLNLKCWVQTKTGGECKGQAFWVVVG